MNDRAYSFLEIKKLDDDARIISGMATTPRPDRVGDIVEPLGATFAAEVPLLWQHRHDQPIGIVKFGKPTKDGIPFTATIAKIAEEGNLKARVDEAWQSVKNRLVRAVSIGFRALEYAFMDDGGTKFTKTELFELSLVTIPANADATIDQIKKFDAEARAASGQSADVSKLPFVKGDETPTVTKSGTVKIGASKSIARKEGKMKKISEQIEQFTNERALKQKRILEIMQKSAETGETLDAEQADEHDALVADVETIDKHLARLEAVQKLEVKSAAPIKGGTEAEGQEARSVIQVKTQPKPEAGISFARVARVKGLAAKTGLSTLEVARNLYGEQSEVYGNIMKAAVGAGNTTTTGWAAELVGNETSAFADFVEYLRPQTILGRFGNGGVPSLRQIPFRTRIAIQTAGASAQWVAEGKAKPLTRATYDDTNLLPLKVATIAVLTEELIRDSSPSAERLIRDELAAAVRERLDIDFIDPNKAASSGVSPASITNGVAAIPSAGPTADDVRTDIKAVFGAFISANNAPTNGVWIMSSVTALALSLMQNPLGQAEFPGLTMTGGVLFGLPVIVSEYVPTVSAGSYVALVNASDIFFADEGGINIDVSREASLEMNDAPTHNSTTPTAATSMVSLWQTNSVGFRAERTLNWARRRPSAVALLSGVNWGAGS